MVFEKCRAKDVDITNMQASYGVMSQDKIFEVSTLEHNIEVVPGVKITDSSGLVWTVYRVRKSTSFCVIKMWARCVALCYMLTEKVDVLKKNCECVDCVESDLWDRIGTVRGSIRADSGRQQSQDERSRMVVSWRGLIDSWNFELPGPDVRLRSEQGTFIIRGFQNQGSMAPFILNLEAVRESNTEAV